MTDCGDYRQSMTAWASTAWLEEVVLRQKIADFPVKLGTDSRLL